ncbi:matrixin family metalloprotease, partial [bacterium LRH843]|nr:matrixin family metalloprotease [bacterium LRH843]
KTHLTYKITRYPAELSKPRIDDVMKRAFAVWEAVTPLTFEYQPSGEVDIDILFARGEHGDGAEAAFDGPGSVLAHAYFPDTAYSGDAHFDEDEPFTIDANNGVSLLQVAAHEFGHP